MYNLKGNPEILIKEVHARRPIWDLKSPAHHNRDIVHKLWTEISNKLGVPLEVVKNKWKHLRDNFRTELKKTVRGSGNPPQPYQSQWTFFKDLLFLEEQMMKKINRIYAPYPYNTNTDSHDNNNGDNFTNYEDDNNDVDNANYLQSHSVFDDNSLQDQEPISWWLQNDLVNTSSNFISLNNGNGLNAIKRRRFNNENEMRSNLVNFSNQSNAEVIGNDDYHFMMSLLPYVKSLPAPRKMYLRLKLQEFICNFIYKLDSTIIKNEQVDCNNSSTSTIDKNNDKNNKECNDSDNNVKENKT